VQFLKAAILAFCMVAGPAVAQAPAVKTRIVGQAVGKVPATPQPAGGRTLTKEDADAWLDGFIPYALRSGDIAGATIAVVKDGKILTTRGFPARTLFRPGSVSKLITWTAVMQQVEAGKLDLDADVNRYLDFKIPAYQGKPIAMRQIMTHTTGFNEVSEDVVYFAAKPQRSLDRYVKEALPRRIFAPGITPSYSNYATALAGYIVQRLSGEDFDTYVERHIFAPLGMHNSTFRQPLPAGLAGQMSKGYARASEPAKPFEIVGPTAAGSLATTADDMARFMLAHLQDGMLDGRMILKPETARLMRDSPLDRIAPQSLIPPLSRMELGFIETKINDLETVGHLGSLNSFFSALHLFPTKGVGIFISLNSQGKQGAVTALRLALLQDFADRYFPSTEAPAQIDRATAIKHAQLMAGQWEFSRKSEGNFFAITNLLGQASVSFDPNGDLVADFIVGPDGTPRRWKEIAPFVWRDVNGHDRLAAQVIDGAPVRWSFDLLAPFQVYDRAPFSRSAAWIIPALIASIVILILTLLFWPAAWLVRRRYAAPLELEGRQRTLYRARGLFAGLELAVLLGWTFLIVGAVGDTFKMTPAFYACLWFLQVGGLIVFLGAIATAALWASATLLKKTTWRRRIWSVAFLLATLMIPYFAWTFGLLAMTTQY
jgi:CubicO group peptidase (beta-lactamase class C family)